MRIVSIILLAAVFCSGIVFFVRRLDASLADSFQAVLNDPALGLWLAGVCLVSGLVQEIADKRREKRKAEASLRERIQKERDEKDRALKEERDRKLLAAEIAAALAWEFEERGFFASRSPDRFG